MSSDTARIPHRSIFGLPLASWFLLLAILLLAAALRFYHLDWVEYKYDEAYISRMALDMARRGEIPLWGMGSSVGIRNGALPVWLLSIPYVVSTSPLVATGFVAALNVLAVAMTFAFTRRIAGPTAGLVAALLFAVAPWAVINSRKLWAQDLLLPFVVAYLWTASLAFVENKRWWLVAHVVVLGACIQLHYSALVLVFLTAFCIVLFWWRRWTWKVVAVTVAAGILAFAPMLYLDVQYGWPNVRLLVRTVLYRKSVIDATALRLSWIMVTGTDLHSLAGPDEFRNYLNSTLPVTPALIVLGLVVVAALAWSLWRAARNWRDPQARATFLVALGLVFPVLLFVWHSTPVYPHYFILLYPWPYVLVGMFFAWIVHRRPSWAMWGGGLIALLVAAQIYGYVSILHFVAGRNTPGGYGTPLGLTLQAVRAAERMAREVKGSVLVLADSDDVETDTVASVWSVLVDPALDPRVVDRRQAMVYPSAPAVVVHAPGRFASSREVVVPLRPGEGEYTLARWRGGDPALLLALVPRGSDRWVNGVQLLGADVLGDAHPGGTLRWRLTWRVNTLGETADYHWTNQLYGADGKRVWQQDGVGFPARSWRAGDVVVTEFAGPLEAGVQPGAYTMHVGLYTYPDVKTVPTMDGLGYIELGSVGIK